MQILRKKLVLPVLVLPILMVLGLIAGCESDSVTPNDPLPTLTEEDAAWQSGVLAVIIAKAAPQLIQFTDPSKAVYEYSFTGFDAITGSVMLDFRTGGSGGTPATPSGADFCHLYTEDGESVVFTTDAGGSLSVTLDISSSLDQAANTATIQSGSSGTFSTGDYSGTFAFDDLVVSESSLTPASGGIVVTSGGFAISVVFDGGTTATVTAGTTVWIVNLNTGVLTLSDD